MANMEDSIKSGENPSRYQEEITENGGKAETLFSPRFRSVAAMAGWDEEALLIASFIVEDTPDRQLKHKKRSGLQNSKTPPSNSRRKRSRRSPASTPITVLNLDEDLDASTSAKQGSEKVEARVNTSAEVEKSSANEKVNTKNSALSSSPSIPCIDRLREELSCAICLEICYEPSTTPCGHSFCKQCLRSAADKCGKKCPKCRQLISNGRYSTVNTVLWNTIQLLFPQEVEARKIAAATSSPKEPQKESSSRDRRLNGRNRYIQALNSPESGPTGLERRNHRVRSRNLRPSGILSSRDVNTRIELPSQDEDAALALRLQREEYMETVRVPDERRNSRVPNERRNSREPDERINSRVPDERRDSVAVARANLRAMASRAISVRIRDRTR